MLALLELPSGINYWSFRKAKEKFPDGKESGWRRFINSNGRVSTMLNPAWSIQLVCQAQVRQVAALLHLCYWVIFALRFCTMLITEYLGVFILLVPPMKGWLKAFFCIYVEIVVFRFFHKSLYFCFWKICLGSFDFFFSPVLLPDSGNSVIVPGWFNGTAAVVLTWLQYMQNTRCFLAHIHVLCSHAQKVWSFRETFTLHEWHSCWVLEQRLSQSVRLLTSHCVVCMYVFLFRTPGIKIYRETSLRQIFIFHIFATAANSVC